MPPRPRPRPRPITKSSSSLTSVSPTKPVLSPGRTPEVIDIDAPTPLSPTKSPTLALRSPTKSAAEDEHDWFDRSSRRRLAVLVDRAAKTPEPIGGGSPESTPSSARKRKREPEAKLPAWTRGKRPDPVSVDKAPVLTIPSDDEENSDDDVVVVSSSTPRPVRAAPPSPPPRLRPEQRERIRQLAKDAVAGDAAPHSSESDDGDITLVIPQWREDELDPELAAIAARARAQSHARERSASRSLGESLEPEVVVLGSQPRVGEMRGPEKVELNVRIYPVDWTGEGDNARIGMLKFKVKRGDSFRRAFLMVAERGGIKVDDLIVTRDHKRVWGSATPHSLKIWNEASLDAYTSSVFELVETHRQQYRASLEPSAEVADSQPSEPDEPASQEVIHVNLLAAGRDKPLRVMARRTTTIGKMLKGFLAKTGNEGKRGAIVFEGEEMDPNSVIGDHDLEDGDQLEVKIF